MSEAENRTSRELEFERLVEQSGRLRSTNPTEALRLVRSALQLVQGRAGFEAEAAIATMHLGDTLGDLGDYETGARHLGSSIEIFRNRADWQLQSQASLLLGELRRKSREYRAAHNLLDEALKGYRRIGHRGGELRALVALGRLYSDIRDNLKALELFHQSLPLARELELAGELEDPRIFGDLLSDIAKVHEAVEEYDTALDYFDRSRAAFAQVNNHRMDEVAAITHLARVYLRLGRLDMALDSAERARAIYTDLHERIRLADVLEIIGQILERTGEPGKALDHYRKRIDILAESDDDRTYAAALLTQGRVLHQMNRLNDATPVLEEALFIARETGEIELQGEIHHRLSLTLKDLEDTARALFHFEQYAILREQVLGLDRQQAIAELEARYDAANTRNENERLRRESEESAAALASLESSLIAKQNLIRKLRTLAEKIEQSANAETVPLARKLLQTIQTEARNDDTEQRVNATLDRRYLGFRDRLAALCPELTRMERRVCAMTRLGMTTGAIADLLCVVRSGIENHRNRIRRKLHLSPDVRLEVFLESV